MESADRKTYDVLFAAECLEGHAAATVRDALGRLFRADEATLDKLFSGTPQRIKAGVDRETALQYRQAMAAAGARAILRPPLPDSAAAAAAPVNEGAAAELSLEPAGSDVLRSDERESVTAAAPDTSHLSVAAAGENLGSTSSAAPPSLEAPDYDLAAVGSDLGQAAPAVPAPPPDTSALSLAEGPLDLSDCLERDAEPPALDLSHLSVANAGDDLLPEGERRPPEARVPDTSHLRLEEPEASAAHGDGPA